MGYQGKNTLMLAYMGQVSFRITWGKVWHVPWGTVWHVPGRVENLLLNNERR